MLQLIVSKDVGGYFWWSIHQVAGVQNSQSTLRFGGVFSLYPELLVGLASFQSHYSNIGCRHHALTTLPLPHPYAIASRFPDLPLESLVETCHPFIIIQTAIPLYYIVYDGAVYKALTADRGPLSENFPFSMSFTVNIDGVPVFKSSSIYIHVANVSYNQ